MRKRTWPRRIFRSFAWLLLVLIVLFGLQLTVLAFPQMIMSNSARSGTVVLYYDGDPDPAMDRLAADVEKRLRGSRFHDPSRTDPVFFFRDQSLYNFYARLSLLPMIPQGYNLSLLGNTYVCGPIVATLGDGSGGTPKYSIWEGNPAHTIAHEIGHQYIADRIGRGGWKKLPHWKQEGIPEYIANIGAVREDPAATLSNRIATLNDAGRWGATPPGRRPGWDRIHFEAGLLVEFCFEVRGMALEEIIADRVTREDTYAAMMAWYEGRRTAPSSI